MNSSQLLKGRSEIFLNIVAVHTEGLRHPPCAYSTHFFRVSVPLNMFTCGPGPQINSSTVRGDCRCYTVRKDFLHYPFKRVM
jgi:hypothetical protein